MHPPTCGCDVCQGSPCPSHPTCWRGTAAPNRTSRWYVQFCGWAHLHSLQWGGEASHLHPPLPPTHIDSRLGLPCPLKQPGTPLPLVSLCVGISACATDHAPPPTTTTTTTTLHHYPPPIVAPYNLPPHLKGHLPTPLLAPLPLTPRPTTPLLVPTSHHPTPYPPTHHHSTSLPTLPPKHTSHPPPPHHTCTRTHKLAQASRTHLPLTTTWPTHPTLHPIETSPALHHSTYITLQHSPIHH